MNHKRWLTKRTSRLHAKQHNACKCFLFVFHFLPLLFTSVQTLPKCLIVPGYPLSYRFSQQNPPPIFWCLTLWQFVLKNTFKMMNNFCCDFEIGIVQLHCMVISKSKLSFEKHNNSNCYSLHEHKLKYRYSIFYSTPVNHPHLLYCHLPKNVYKRIGRL